MVLIRFVFGTTFLRNLRARRFIPFRLTLDCVHTCCSANCKRISNKAEWPDNNNHLCLTLCAHTHAHTLALISHSTHAVRSSHRSNAMQRTSRHIQSTEPSVPECGKRCQFTCCSVQMRWIACKVAHKWDLRGKFVRGIERFHSASVMWMAYGIPLCYGFHSKM